GAESKGSSTPQSSGSGTRPAANALPIMLVTDPDRAAGERVAAALTRRFGSDYQIRLATSEGDGLAMLEDLARERARVALVAADLSLTREDGNSTFLERAHLLHPHARRMLLVSLDRRGTRIPFESLATIRL